MKNRPEYNDGVMHLYISKGERTDSGAWRNIKTMTDLVELTVADGYLVFGAKSIRQQDMEFADASERSISLKVVTPDNGSINTDRLARIGSIIYSIIHIDRDLKTRELYFYLEELRRLKDV